MKTMTWNEITTMAIIACLVIATLFIIGCIITGSVQFIMSWICTDYILGLIFGVWVLTYLRKNMKKGETKEDEAT